MRNFGEVDKLKKQSRIKLEENPGNLSQELAQHLEEMVKATLKGGYLSCPTAWRIAKEAKVSKIAVGQTADKLGVRVTDCQLGCFKVDKIIHDKIAPKKIDDSINATLATMEKNNNLTCEKVFELALRLKIKPMVIADIANFRNMKIQCCQLGCF
ncbi:MAG: hypothetical protein V1767_05580 [Chloroflexota bacterium]